MHYVLLELLIVLGVVRLFAERADVPAAAASDCTAAVAHDGEGVSVHRHYDREDHIHDEIEEAERAHRPVGGRRGNAGIGSDLAVGEEDAHEGEEELGEHGGAAHEEARGERSGVALEYLPRPNDHEEYLKKHAPRIH